MFVTGINLSKSSHVKVVSPIVQSGISFTHEVGVKEGKVEGKSEGEDDGFALGTDE